MMTRCFCDPKLTTFGELDIGDVFRYPGGMSQFIKKDISDVECEDNPFVELFSESPHAEVVRNGYYRSEPEESSGPLPCPSETPNQGAQSESGPECSPQEKVYINLKGYDFGWIPRSMVPIQPDRNHESLLC